MSSYRSRIATLVVITSFLQWSCGDSPLPTQPSTPLQAERGGVLSAQAVPNAVFRTIPPDSGDFITGPMPLEVMFNMCPSRPGDESDDLKFTYDWNADGTVDWFGACRRSNVFQENATVRVCVSDRRPDNEVCHTFEVRPVATSSESQPDFIATMSSLGCFGDLVQAVLFAEASIQPPLPVGQSYSFTATVHDPAPERRNHRGKEEREVTCRQ